MAGADGDGQTVTTAAGGEVDHLFGFRIVALLGLYLVLDAGQHAQLCLDGHVVGMCILDHLLRDADVLLIGE